MPQIDRTSTHVIYFDEHSRPHAALVTADWGKQNPEGTPGPMNLVYVSKDPERQDSYGQQIMRPTSVAHWKSPGYDQIFGNCWAHEHEQQTEEFIVKYRQKITK